MIAIDRHEQHIDTANLVELLLTQRVMQMAEMGDAHVRGLENEDRVAMTLGTAAPVADVGGHIAHAHVANLKVVAGRLDLGSFPSRAGRAGYADRAGRCKCVLCA